MLTVTDLRASIEDKEILKGLNITQRSISSVPIPCRDTWCDKCHFSEECHRCCERSKRTRRTQPGRYTDSGLDIDALKIVSDAVNALRSPDRSFIIVTHYQRLLNYIVPDFVHVLYDGRIVKSGDKDLALRLEAEGYDWVKEEAQLVKG